MAFLFFTAYRCSVPWQFLFTFPAFIPHYNIENPKHVLYFAGVLLCLIFLILFFSLPKFCLCSLYHYFSLIFFLPLQEMAHILAQKQLRSIILSVSLTMPFPSSPLQCIFPSLSLFISFRVYASAAEWYQKRKWHLPCLPLSHIAGYYLLYLLSHTCSPFLFFILSLVLNLISASPVLSSDLCFLILLIHSQILLFSFLLSRTAFLQNPCLVFLTQKTHPLSFTLFSHLTSPLPCLTKSPLPF